MGVYVVRDLGPTAYGEQSHAFSLVGLFAALASLGIPGIVARELVKAPSRKRELLGTTFGLSFFVGLVTIGLIAVITPLTGATELERRMILIISAEMVAETFRVFDYYFQSIVQSRYVVQIQIVHLVLSSLAKLVLIWTNAELLWFAAVSLIEAIVLAIGLVFNYHRTQLQSPGFLSWRFRWNTAQSLVVDGWPLVFFGVVMAVYMRIDQVMAGAVGQYAAAVRISEAWYFVPMLIIQSYFPAILEARHL